MQACRLQRKLQGRLVAALERSSSVAAALEGRAPLPAANTAQSSSSTSADSAAGEAAYSMLTGSMCSAAGCSVMQTAGNGRAQAVIQLSSEMLREAIWWMTCTQQPECCNALCPPECDVLFNAALQTQICPWTQRGDMVLLWDAPHVHPAPLPLEPEPWQRGCCGLSWSKVMPTWHSACP